MTRKRLYQLPSEITLVLTSSIAVASLAACDDQVADSSTAQLGDGKNLSIDDNLSMDELDGSEKNPANQALEYNSTEVAKLSLGDEGHIVFLAEYNEQEPTSIGMVLVSPGGTAASELVRRNDISPLEVYLTLKPDSETNVPLELFDDHARLAWMGKVEETPKEIALTRESVFAYICAFGMKMYWLAWSMGYGTNGGSGNSFGPFAYATGWSKQRASVTCVLSPPDSPIKVGMAVEQYTWIPSGTYGWVNIHTETDIPRYWALSYRSGSSINKKYRQRVWEYTSSQSNSVNDSTPATRYSEGFYLHGLSW